MNEKTKDHLGNEYDSIKEMCSAYKITISTFYQRRKKGMSLEKILNTPQRLTDKQSLIGQKFVNNKGLEIEIIDASKGTHNLTIRFTEDGFIKEHVYLTDLKKGKVSKTIPHRNKKEKLVGTRLQMKNGEWATIEKYIPSKNSSPSKCNIIFDNGDKVTCNYSTFKVGKIQSHQFKKQKKENLLLNKKDFLKREWNLSKNNEKFKIVEDLGNSAIVLFENDIKKTYKWNTILNLKIKSNTLEKYNIGDVITNKNGFSFEIINIHYENNIRLYDVKDLKTNELLYNKQMGNLQNKKNKKNKIEEFIGKESTSIIGEPIKIIGGQNLQNLTILFLNDGFVKEGCSYYNFKLNKISRNYQHTILTMEKNEKEGTVIRQKCGLNATLIEYKDCKNVIVQFENGEIVETTSFSFFKGLVSPKNLKTLNSTPFNEFVVGWCLKDFGFKKAERGSLDSLGFGGKELDLFNSQYKIAIEYDGFYHSKITTKDIEKDILCKKNGITILRIRENDVNLLNDGISKEWLLDDNHYFSPSFISVLNEVANYISLLTNQKIILPNLKDDSIQKEIIHQYSKKTTFFNRIGEQKINNQGFLMEIIDYRIGQKCDVKFENGYIAKNREYSSFLKGNIMCKEQHYGEEFISKRGEKIKIISKNFGQTVDVQFEDGTIKKNIQYCKLINKQIANPNYVKKYEIYNHIGEQVVAKNGLIGTIIDVTNPIKRRVKVQMENGYIIEDTYYSHFKKGYMKVPGLRACKKRM